MKQLLPLVFLFLTYQVQAQINIHVVDQQTGNSLKNVRVKAGNSPIVNSNSEGKITLDFIESTEIIFALEGYETLSRNFEPGDHEVHLTPNSINLASVTVSAFESERPLLEQSSAIAIVTERDFNRFNETSIVNSFNTKPGIRIEERAPASYRVSIRGSSLRAPFGVRNVKVYWNDVPFTAPDGTTPLNLLDLSNIRAAEIIKGPSGSIYGAGNGGVIDLKNQTEPQGGKISTDLMTGSFGLSRYRLALNQPIGNGGIEASYVRQKSDGYREQSAMDRKVFQLGGLFKASGAQEIRTQLLISDLNYQIPGGLNADQVAEDPTQARPGSVEQNSSIAQQSVYASLGHLYHFSNATSNNTTLYLTTTDFENPFNLDYKKELSYGYGGRTKFTINTQLGGKDLRLISGAEYQSSRTDAQNFGNRGGVADTIRFADKLKASQGFLFQQAEWQGSEELLITLGLSENFSSFEIDRQIDASGGPIGLQKRTFDPILVPRLAFNYRINESSSLYSSISSGFSPPTIDEVRTNEGSLNLDLEAEKGLNSELGYRLGRDRLNVDATVFYFQLKQTITTYTNEQGVVLFRNAGATDQKGIELALDYTLIQNSDSFLSNLQIGTAFTGHYFKFKDYQNNDNDYSGNDLTGVPPNNLITRLDLRTKPGIYLNFTHQFTDEIPLNDSNTVYQDAYNLVNLRFGWAKWLGTSWELEVFGGVDNLLNESYSLGNDLNPFGGRFYQPAPTSNWYGGIKAAFNY